MLQTRQATTDDADAVAYVYTQSWQAAYRGMIPDDILDAVYPKKWARQWRGRNDPGRITWLAFDGSEPVGMISFGPDRADAQHGEIYAIYVLPDRQRQGIGAKLLGTALELLEPAQIRLWCAADKTDSLLFYRRFGFLPNGIVGEYHIGSTRLTTVQYSLTR